MRDIWVDRVFVKMNPNRPPLVCIKFNVLITRSFTWIKCHKKLVAITSIGIAALFFLLAEDFLYDFADKHRYLNPGQQKFQMDTYYRWARQDSERWISARNEFIKKFTTVSESRETFEVRSRIIQIHASYLAFLESTGQRVQMIDDMAHDFEGLQTDKTFVPTYTKLTLIYKQLRSSADTIKECHDKYQDTYNAIVNHDNSDKGRAQEIMLIGSSISDLFSDRDKKYEACGNAVLAYDQAFTKAVAEYSEAIRRMNIKAEEEEQQKKILHILSALFLALMPGVPLFMKNGATAPG